MNFSRIRAPWLWALLLTLLLSTPAFAQYDRSNNNNDLDELLSELEELLLFDDEYFYDDDLLLEDGTSTVSADQPSDYPGAPGGGYMWEEGVTRPDKGIVDGFWRKSARSGFLWQDSGVVDAFSGRKRQFALQGSYALSVNFRHDLKNWGMSYSLDFTKQGPRIVSEFDRFREGNPRSNLRLTIEKQVWDDVIIRFLWNNVFKTTSRRKTTVFQTNQASGIVSGVEFRRITPQVSVGIGLIGKF